MTINELVVKLQELLEDKSNNGLEVRFEGNIVSFPICDAYVALKDEDDESDDNNDDCCVFLK